METKYWLDSVTVRGNLLAVLPAIYAVCKIFGLEIPEGLLDQIIDGIAAVLTLVSIVMIFIGSFKKDRRPLGFSKHDQV